MQPLDLFDFERLASERLPGPTWGYYESGAHDELTLRDNRSALERIVIRHRVLVDVASRTVQTTALGAPIAMPVLVATTAFLAEVAVAARGRAEIYVDGGVRRGTDVLEALARGARAVLVGRPILWGLAADGRDGARRVLEMLGEELDLAMALAGCPTVADITGDLLA